MDSQNNAKALSLYPDPFTLAEQGDDDAPSFPLQSPNRPLTTPVQVSTSAVRHAQSLTGGTPGTATQPTPHPFTSPSPSPSPANLAFNPDDFFASPPQHVATSAGQVSERFTPELKRRLFCPPDGLLSTSTAQRKSSKPSTLGLQTPIPQPSFVGTGQAQPTPDDCNSLAISPNLSPPRGILPEIMPNTDALNQPDNTTIGLKKGLFMPQIMQALPGTPFTPATVPKVKCSCKASRCLKLYCPCFAGSGFCGEGCTCKNCQNSQATSLAVREARQTVLTRDPRAFEPKVRNSPATASGDIHTKGCNCRKGCAKNYCVCRELGVDCGPRCTCSGPNGCLNGKSDGGDSHVKGKAGGIPPAARIGPSPGRFRTGLPPAKPVRDKPHVSAGAPKQEKKRQKRDSRDFEVERVSNPDTPHILSPSFPSLNMDVSPTTMLRDNLEDYRDVMAGDDDLITPFALRKDQNSIGFRTPDQGPKSLRHAKSEGAVQLCSITFPSFGNDSPGPVPFSRLRSKGRATADQADREPSTPTRRMTLTGIGQDLGGGKVSLRPFARSRLDPDTANASFSKRSGLHRDSEMALEDSRKSDAVGAEKSRTPETTPRLPDVDFASSPATGRKDAQPPVWNTHRGVIFGREDRVDMPRLPRILRVKMGSGRQLRKFDI